MLCSLQRGRELSACTATKYPSQWLVVCCFCYSNCEFKSLFFLCWCTQHRNNAKKSIVSTQTMQIVWYRGGRTDTELTCACTCCWQTCLAIWCAVLAIACILMRLDMRFSRSAGSVAVGRNLAMLAAISWILWPAFNTHRLQIYCHSCARCICESI